MNLGYINKLIRQGTTFIRTSKGTIYRLVYFEDLNKVYIYTMSTSDYNRKYRPPWKQLGPVPINKYLPMK